MILFDQNTPVDDLNNYLKNRLNFLNKNEALIQTEIAGEGNMNVVMRLKTNQRSFILKQSRPFVRKYPDIAAPLNRIDVEYNFYKQVRSHSFFPKILKYVPINYLLLMEDIGNCEDLTSVYKSGEVSRDFIQQLTTGLLHIHQQVIPKEYPKNRILRELNHQHIFVLPFKNNGFSLDNIQEGLETLAKPFKNDKVLNYKIDRAGKAYMRNGDTLLHGDYYPGSWMRVRKHFFIIDPEFSFAGPKEFDLGVMAAHLILASGQNSVFDQVCKAYRDLVKVEQVQTYCGIEIIRRLIGLAQLPLERTLEQKKNLLNLARKYILS